jgi:hypothetical protein
VQRRAVAYRHLTILHQRANARRAHCPQPVPEALALNLEFVFHDRVCRQEIAKLSMYV